jgi:prepilin-type N-terminal cleavage/methylation domain-containing protein
MTLIEMMVVVLIVAVAATGLSVGFGALTRTHLRSACMRVAAGARYAFNRAISQGTTVRLAFDFGSHRMSFEEADGNVMLARVDDARRLDIEGGDEASDAAAVDPWAAARARLEDTLRPSFGASPFTTLEGSRYQPTELADGVEIARLITPHEAEPREEGTGHIYFFASGQTEHAVVWVSDGGGRTFSVELHPLTGRARVREGAFEPEELILDGDEESSEVRE